LLLLLPLLLVLLLVWKLLPEAGSDLQLQQLAVWWVADCCGIACNAFLRASVCRRPACSCQYLPALEL
jgi:hypothetical protein